MCKIKTKYWLDHFHLPLQVFSNLSSVLPFVAKKAYIWAVKMGTPRFVVGFIERISKNPNAGKEVCVCVCGV